MKKAFFAALCFVLISCLFVNGTFALPDLNKVFTIIASLGDSGKPTQDEGLLQVKLESTYSPGQLMPGGSASRTTVVKNTGEENAYFRLVYAIQYDKATWDLLKVNFNVPAGYRQEDWTDIDIDGTPYKMKVFSYDKVLYSNGNVQGMTSASSVSPAVTITIEMDKSITNQQLSCYRDDFLQVQVLAVETETFAELVAKSEDVKAGKISPAQYVLDMAIPLAELNPF